MSDKMPERIYTAINDDENVLYEFVASSKPNSCSQGDKEYIRADLYEQASYHYFSTLEFIAKIARLNYEQDENLRSKGARTLLRILKKAEEALDTFQNSSTN